MKKFATVSIAIALFAVTAAAVSQSQDAPAESELTPARDQQWLRQLVGEWDVRFKLYMQPDQPPVESAGTDSVRALGGHWIVAETKFTMMGAPFSGMLSLGYDPQKEHFNATWIDSMGGHLWVYTGELNDAGDALTLRTEGPSMHNLNETARYKEVITITGDDTRTFTSNIEGEDGEWIKILEAEYRRKAGNAEVHRDRSAPDTKNAVNVHYLEIVTPETDATCDLLEQSQGVTFSEPAAERGNARTARLSDGSRIGVRAPMHEGEEPVVRPYVLVDDIDAAVKAAQAAGAEVMMPPTEIPGQGTFAIYYLGGIEHGLWQN